MGRPKKIKDEEYFQTHEDMVAMSWCLKNKMRCFVKPYDDGYKIIFEYVENGIIKEKESPYTYLKNESSRVIARIYKHQYSKSFNWICGKSQENLRLGSKNEC